MRGLPERQNAKQALPKERQRNRHSDRHGADKSGDLITADTFFSYDGVSEDGDVIGVVVCDAYTGWLACYPAAAQRRRSPLCSERLRGTKREGRPFL